MKSIPNIVQVVGFCIATMIGSAASAETLEVGANVGSVPWEFQGCDQVALLESGQIIETDDPRALCSESQPDRTKAFLSKDSHH